eukprot:4600058-Amphidinium_carterae.1
MLARELETGNHTTRYLRELTDIGLMGLLTCVTRLVSDMKLHAVQCMSWPLSRRQGICWEAVAMDFMSIFNKTRELLTASQLS